MRLAGLLLIFFGIAFTGMGLVDLVRVGMNLPMAGAGIIAVGSGIAAVVTASRMKESRGFEVKLTTGNTPVLPKKEVDHG